MSKLLLVVVLILGVASVANAEVLYLKVVDIGMSLGHTGEPGNSLYPSDIVGLEVWLSQTGPASQYGGYWIDGLDIALTVTGPGSVDVGPGGISVNPPSGRLYGAYAVDAVVENPQEIAIDGNASYNGWTPFEDLTGDGDLLLFDNLRFHREGFQAVTVALELDGPAVPGVWNYAGIGSVNYTSSESNWWKYPGPSRYWTSNPNVREMVPADLGSILFHQVPEPVTLAIISLGGLALWRRGKAVG